MGLENSQLATYSPKEQEPELSALDYFKDSFKSAADRQITGLSQIVGSDRKSRQEYPEANTETGRNAQVLGRAAADIIPVIITAAALRHSAKGPAIKGLEEVGFVPKPSMFGIEVDHSMATGLLTQGLLKESDETHASDVKALVVDRFKSGIIGGLSFTAATGTGYGIAKFVESLERGPVKVLLSNPIGNSLASGVPIGLANIGVQSFVEKRLPEIGEIKKSVADMTLVSGISSVLGTIGALRAPRVPEPVFEGTFKPLEQRDLSGPILAHRNFIRPTEADPAMAGKTTTELWLARADELSEVIASRVNRMQPSREEFFKIADSYPRQEQEIARKLLEKAAAVSTDYAVLKTAQSLGEQLQSFNVPYTSRYDLIVQEPASSGSMLAYLMKKTHSEFNEFNFMNGKKTDGQHVFFVDPAKLSDAQRTEMIAEAARRPVYIPDTNFDRLPNVLDLALGEDRVKAKLDPRIAETKAELAKNPDLSIDQAIESVLTGPTERAVARLNQEAGPDSKGFTLVKPEPISVDEAFAPRANSADVRFMLDGASTYDDRRLMVAEMLAEDVEFHTFGSVAQKMQTLHAAIEHSAKRRGLDPANDRFVVAPSDMASSESFMTYIYAHATGLANDRIKTYRELKTDPQSVPNDARLITIDDAVYSGIQAKSMLQTLAENHHGAVATLSSFEPFAKLIGKSQDSPRRELISLQTDFSYSHNEALAARLNPASRATLEQLLAGQGFVGITSLKLFPHMVADSAPTWLRDFSQKFIKPHRNPVATTDAATEQSPASAPIPPASGMSAESLKLMDQLGEKASQVVHTPEYNSVSGAP